ncbi:hypothetical protein ARV1_gp36 [Acidianus rod-shaped virus 1]|uniref:Putative transcriptional regulator n=1 Tax=Acidianus rod-shaped virus 1 TaxID=309181 RepID=Q50I35_9VIRU|nr:hypothetical protein ARV1_gp36 [Acidianus rod-shaped virus 1]MCY0882119.1 ribbon-helix-helix protein, CopG family [Bacillota bacterium]CAI44191.1 putative transcriptional regulator [Acidianus rod-shaped virus 1]
MGLKVFSFKSDPDLVLLLDQYAAKLGINRSEAIRRAIAKMVEDELKPANITKAKVEKLSL